MVGSWRDTVASDERCALAYGWKDEWLEGGLRGGMAGAGTERNGTEMDGCRRMDKGVGGVGGGGGRGKGGDDGNGVDGWVDVWGRWMDGLVEQWMCG